MFSSNASQVSADANYIEDVFSTYLYTGNGSTQTITNGIDLAGEGGLVWLKQRDLALDHLLMDSARGATNYLSSNTTSGQNAGAPVTFTSIGLSIASGGAFWNQSSNKYASWTFRKQPKFFDVVTYTGNDVAGRTVAHNLGSVPGVIIVKSTSAAGDWAVYHRSLGATQYTLLNSTAAAVTDSSYWQNTAPTSTEFTLGGAGRVNYLGRSYVAYLFAHDAGGFGLTGEDNVISCGSYTGNGSATGPVVTLGYEPQFVILKSTVESADWFMMDTMRGMTVNSDQTLSANTSTAEISGNNPLSPLATGFQITEAGTGYNTNGNIYIYIAIRRGPMKTPTTGTSVFGLNARTGTGANATVTGSAGVSDAVLIKNRGAAVASLFSSRLTGTGYLVTSTTAAEVAAGATILQANPWDVMDGVKVGTTSTITNASANTYINYLFDRAPGFMDVVCYTGTGVARTVAHNLAAVPEMMIVKERNTAGGWKVYSAPTGAGQYLFLNSDAAPVADASFYTWNNTAPTSSVFSLGIASDANQSGATYVAYLFASCPGVSKIGTFTYPGTSTVDCGFSSGARFVMLKRTSTSGGWLVFDTARGIVSGNDPYLELQSTNAEVTTGDVIDPSSSGFAIGSNFSNGTYIFLAIA